MLHRADGMRIPNQFLKATVFVVSIARFADDGSVLEYDFEGTGFLIGLRCKNCAGQSFFYLVTANHLVSNANVRYGVRINLKQGGTTIVQIERWYKHPDPSVDVAVAPFINQYEQYDVVFLPEECFLGLKVQMASKDIGIGDEVFFAGLFSLTQQESDPRNRPILRMGNIAMLPSLPVPTEFGLMEAYLIEARSIGGISGSPVLARQTMSIIWNDEVTGPVKALHGVTGECFLIGVMHGHWDVKETEINQARIEPTSSRSGVNVGIAIVSPFSKVLDIINQAELVEQRGKLEEAYLRHSGTTAD